MKRLETLPTRSEWLSRLDEFYSSYTSSLFEDDVLTIFYNESYLRVRDVITMSISRLCGGLRCYERSWYISDDNLLISLPKLIDDFISKVLRIDRKNYQVTIAPFNRLILRLYTTPEVCV